MKKSGVPFSAVTKFELAEKQQAIPCGGME
jgi:hypothetical protein